MTNKSLPLAPIRLAVIDIDGTLVGADLNVTTRVRNAIKAAQDRGVHVALCTGRPEISSRHYVEPLNLYGYHIFDAGATISDPLGETILYQKTLSLDIALPIIRYAREHNLYLELYTSGKYFVERATEHTRIHAELQGVNPIVGDLAEIAAQHQVIKLESAAMDDVEAARVQVILDHFSEEIDYGWAMAPGVTMRFVNILSPGVSKGEAVEYLTQHLSLSRAQVMGVGDGPNDEPLLRAVGFPVAMGNSIDSLKEIAAYIAPDVEEDGLAQTIEQFILKVEYRL